MLWEKKGKVNTDQTLALAVARGRELGIRHYVVASCTGETAEKLTAYGENVVCVTQHTGFDSPGEQGMTPATMENLRGFGVHLLTTTHLLGGIDRAVENKFGGSYPGGIVAHTLRMLGQGTKVCVEVAVMALDAGLIPYGEEIISVGGSGQGADTALVIFPAHAKDFFNCEIREIICKPRYIK
jgi:hypothetical protein